ncbi:hypothetical protein [Brevundimonas sp.]|uniref:hypothetical protein n=1 Tax=Brevundimonas sp. TaxID=1871086 RepID=UPI0027377D9E|nr:hypothetical protein [Brevundimonas sp.]MDP3803662.1 hypothetical protein [Brevundimonas sp.]
MSRPFALSGLILAAVVLGGCSWTLDDRGDDTPLGRLDRSERARAEAARTHPDCRDDRADRDDQQDGCRDVVRRD